MDDPANPYRQQYQDWDYWMLAHAGEPTDEQRADFFEDRLPDTWCWDYLAVDADGFVIPHATSLEEMLRWSANGHKSDDDDCSRSFQIFADAPPDLMQRLDELEVNSYARYVSTIPGWLAASPPLNARIWPDGSVTAHGALGSWDGVGDVIHYGADSWSYTSDPYYMYAPDGTLLRQTKEGQEEADLFPGNYRAGDLLDALFFSGWYDKMYLRGRSRGWNGLYINYDYYYWIRPGERDPVEVYDIDGTRYGPDFDMLARDEYKFSSMTGEWLVKLYAAQQAQAVAAP